jgi:hypothetical protein
MTSTLPPKPIIVSRINDKIGSLTPPNIFINLENINSIKPWTKNIPKLILEKYYKYFVLWLI